MSGSVEMCRCPKCKARYTRSEAALIKVCVQCGVPLRVMPPPPPPEDA